MSPGELKLDHKEIIWTCVFESSNVSLLPLAKSLLESADKLKVLHEHVKALGEDQLLAVQGKIAGLDSQQHELERQASVHQQEGEKLQLERKALICRNR